LIEVDEDASVGENVATVRACNPDTESPIYYYLIGTYTSCVCLLKAAFHDTKHTDTELVHGIPGT